jgi:hypothetical protein
MPHTSRMERHIIGAQNIKCSQCTSPRSANYQNVIIFIRAARKITIKAGRIKGRKVVVRRKKEKEILTKQNRAVEKRKSYNMPVHQMWVLTRSTEIIDCYYQ